MFLILTLKEHKMNNHPSQVTFVLLWSSAPAWTPRLTLLAWPFCFCHTFFSPPPSPESCFGCAASGTVFRDLRTMRRMFERFSTASSTHSLFWERFYDLRFTPPRTHVCLTDVAQSFRRPIQRNYLRMTFPLDTQVDHFSDWTQKVSPTITNYSANLQSAEQRVFLRSKRLANVKSHRETTCRCYCKFRSVTLASYLEDRTALSLCIASVQSVRGTL